MRLRDTIGIIQRGHLIGKNEGRSMKVGFMLIDVVIYLALSTILSLYMLSCSSTTYISFIAIQKRITTFVADTIISDVIRRELSMLDSRVDVHDWAKGVFHIQSLDVKGASQECDIGWRLHERGLVRSQGVYIRSRGIWKSKTDTLLLSSIQKLAFTPRLSDDRTQVVAVEMVFDYAQRPLLTESVALRNGAV